MGASQGQSGRVVHGPAVPLATGSSSSRVLSVYLLGFQSMGIGAQFAYWVLLEVSLMSPTLARKTPTWTVAFVALTACSAQPTSETLRPKDGVEDCQKDSLVRWLNDMPTRVREAANEEARYEAAKAELDSHGVYPAGRNKIVARLAGEDGIIGNDDDAEAKFADFEAIDALSGIGPTTLERLLAIVAGRCSGDDSEPTDVSVVFSPQAYEDSHLAEAAERLENAERSIDVAMYSFSDARLKDILIAKAQDGLTVRVIYNKGREECGDVTIDNDAHSCPATPGTMSARLEEGGVDVRYVNKIMHHKFAIVDGVHAEGDDPNDAVLISGSGNWTHGAATSLDENTLFIHRNPELSLRFQREFDKLWAHSRDVVGNDDIEYMETEGITQAMIDAVDDPNVDAIFTSDNFSPRGEFFRVDRTKNVIADRLSQLIANAEHSVYVASGHLRSKPVSDALKARQWQAADERDEEFDMRIYLDSQEFISVSRYGRLLDARATCLEAAGSSESRKAQCYERGFLYGYELYNEAAINVRYKHYAYRWNYSYAPQMHHKYMVFDEGTLITGSYNLSDTAEHDTFENMIIFGGTAHRSTVNRYVRRFEDMWNTTDDSDYEELLGTTEDDAFRIVFAPHSLDWPQINDLKRAMRSACRAIDSEEFRRNPTAHFWCPERPGQRDEIAERTDVDYVYATVGDNDSDMSAFDIEAE